MHEPFLIVVVLVVFVRSDTEPSVTFETHGELYDFKHSLAARTPSVLQVGYEKPEEYENGLVTFELDGTDDGTPWRVDAEHIRGPGYLWLRGMNSTSWVYMDENFQSKLSRMVRNPVCGIVIGKTKTSKLKYILTVRTGCIHTIPVEGARISLASYCPVTVLKLPEEGKKKFCLDYSPNNWNACTVHLLRWPPCGVTESTPISVCYGAQSYLRTTMAIIRCADTNQPVVERYIKLLPSTGCNQCAMNERERLHAGKLDPDRLPKIMTHREKTKNTFTIERKLETQNTAMLNKQSNGLYQLHIHPSNNKPFTLKASRINGSGFMLLYNLEEQHWIDATFEINRTVEYTTSSPMCGMIVESNAEERSKYELVAEYNMEPEKSEFDCTYNVPSNGLNVSLDSKCFTTLFQFPIYRKSRFDLTFLGPQPEWDRCQIHIYKEPLCVTNHTALQYAATLKYGNKQTAKASILIVLCKPTVTGLSIEMSPVRNRSSDTPMNQVDVSKSTQTTTHEPVKTKGTETGDEAFDQLLEDPQSKASRLVANVSVDEDELPAITTQAIITEAMPSASSIISTTTVTTIETTISPTDLQTSTNMSSKNENQQVMVEENQEYEVDECANIDDFPDENHQSVTGEEDNDESKNTQTEPTLVATSSTEGSPITTGTQPPVATTSSIASIPTTPTTITAPLTFTVKTIASSTTSKASQQTSISTSKPVAASKGQTTTPKIADSRATKTWRATAITSVMVIILKIFNTV